MAIRPQLHLVLTTAAVTATVGFLGLPHQHTGTSTPRGASATVEHVALTSPLHPAVAGPRMGCAVTVLVVAPALTPRITPRPTVEPRCVRP
jgi:hypothetical protein